MTLSAKCKQGDPCYPEGSGSPAPATSPHVLLRSNTHTNIRQVPEHTHASLVDEGLSPSHASLASEGLSPAHSSRRALWLSASEASAKGSSRAATLCSPDRPQPNKS